MTLRSRLRRLDRNVSVAVKVAVPVVFISVLAFALLGALSISEATRRIDAAYTAEAADITNLVRTAFENPVHSVASVDDALARLANARPSVERIQVIGVGAGQQPFVYASSLPSDIAEPFSARPVPDSGHTVQTSSTLDDHSSLLVLTGVKLPDGVRGVATYFSLSARQASIANLQRRVTIEALLILLFELIALGLAVRFAVLRRLKRLAGAAEAVAGGDLSVRLPEGAEPAGRDELFNVAREFDGMVAAVEERTAALRDAAERERDDAERLRELDRIKNTLLHAVSHDLRGPLTTILGSAGTLEHADELGVSAEDRAAMLRGLTASARKMHRIVTDLLDLDRLDRGIIAPAREPTDVAALVRRVVAEADLDPDTPIHVEVEPVTISLDAAKVERIVENLLGNAEKHTPRGSEVWVRAGPMDDGVLLAVEDSGPGVPADLHEVIFEPFRQGAELTPGIGIGLSLVSRFAALHGGRAWVEERQGGGASFRVYLPGPPEGPGAVEEGGGRAAARIATERGGRSSIG